MASFSEFNQAVQEAESTLRLADIMADKMARLLIGRLRKVNSYNTLKYLKKELQDYDAKTQQWKN